MKINLFLCSIIILCVSLISCESANQVCNDEDCDGDFNSLDGDEEEETDPCDPNPCDEENKNVCNVNDKGQAECLCNEGYFDGGYGWCVEDTEENRLPQKLDFQLKREESADSLDENEVKDFSESIATFFNEIEYFDYIYRTSHGVDASTGKPDYLWWWSDFKMVKEGDVVTMLHDDLPEHGGHNQHTPNSNLLAGLISGYLVTGNERMRMLSEQFCKGVTATMKGMAYDESDENDHLMARNVIAMNHSFTTDEGYRKAVDYENWYKPYVRWNCARFKYENNPYWGEMWVTNMRSKDDVGRIFRMAVPARYASLYAKDKAVRDACGETYEYLTRFTKDIIDSDYYIRTKNDKGEIFKPGLDENQDPAYDPKDASTFALYDMLAEEGGECLIKRAVALMGYGDGRENECGKTSWNIYEDLAIQNNPPNARIIRANHIAHIAQALIHSDNKAASDSLEGLIDRFARQKEEDISEIRVSQDDWDRDIALNMLQASAYGYPLNADEVREIHKYYLRAIDEYENWGQWNLWDESIPDGTYDKAPSSSKRDLNDEKVSWIRVNNLIAFLEYCWSPFKNPDGLAPVDCDLIKEKLKQTY